jgi:hypothetical protein
VSAPDDVEALRRGFQSLAEAATGEIAPDDLAAVWSAVRGELPPDARRALVDRLAAEPALAEAWRIAHALESPDATAPVATATAGMPGRPRRSWPAPWLATAAVVILGVSAVVLLPRLRESPAVLRQPGVPAIESLLTPGAAVSREAFELRWTAGPPGSRYRVRVTTEDLHVLAEATDLETPVFRVPVPTLAGVAAGGVVFWQVDVVMPSTTRLTSPTFVNRVQ